MSRKTIFTILTFFLSTTVIILILLAIVLFPYIKRKVTTNYIYCNKFSQLHPELGWVLKSNTNSCINLKNSITNKYYFKSEVLINNLGLRSNQKIDKIKTNSTIAIGDSWTFGYGVEYNQSYPHQLEKISKIKTYNQGISAYGLAQSYWKLKKSISEFNPAVVTYLEMGMIQRSICDGNNIEQILFVCYLKDKKTSEYILYIPEENKVFNNAKNNILPGGIYTAGYNFFNFFLTVRIPYILKSKFINLFDDTNLNPINLEHGAKIPESDITQLKYLALKNLIYLSEQNNFKLIIIEGRPSYQGLYQFLNNEEKNNKKFVFIDNEQFKNIFNTRANEKKIKNIFIEKDGHFTSDALSIIAEIFYENF